MKIKRVIYEFDTGEVHYIKDDEAERFLDDIKQVKAIMPSMPFLTWFRESSLWELIWGSTVTKKDDEDSKVSGNAPVLKRYIVEGNIQSAKQWGYSIKYDMYGKAYVKAVSKPDDVDGEFRFKEYTITP